MNLAKASRTGTPQGEDVLPALSRRVESGSARIVLSAANYLETWHRRDWRSRHALAGVMRDLTAYRTIAPIQRASIAELKRVIDESLGRRKTNFSPFGHGVRLRLRMMSPDGRIRSRRCSPPYLDSCSLMAMRCLRQQGRDRTRLASDLAATRPHEIFSQAH